MFESYNAVLGTASSLLLHGSFRHCQKYLTELSLHGSLQGCVCPGIASILHNLQNYWPYQLLLLVKSHLSAVIISQKVRPPVFCGWACPAMHSAVWLGYEDLHIICLQRKQHEIRPLRVPETAPFSFWATNHMPVLV